MYQGLQTFNSQQQCLSAAGTPQSSSSSLTTVQVQSIIGLLQSFGADAATITNVQTSLAGGTPTITQTQTSAGIFGIPSGFSFTRALSAGSIGLDVTYLKTILAQQGCFTASTSNTAVGPLTQAGIKCFQKKYSISPIGTVGPRTNAMLNALLSGSR
jgi:peptidoglycan hydrolase-like protein with peptidoglycan-binding domain